MNVTAVLMGSLAIESAWTATAEDAIKFAKANHFLVTRKMLASHDHGTSTNCDRRRQLSRRMEELRRHQRKPGIRVQTRFRCRRDFRRVWEMASAIGRPRHGQADPGAKT